MEQRCDQVHNNCINFTSDYDIRFNIVTPKQRDGYHVHIYDNHSLVFMLEGEVEFSYNDFLNRPFVSGDIFFIPNEANVYSRVITDAKMLVLTFNNRIESLCDRCRLSLVSKYISEIDYEFKPLRMTDTLSAFATLMENYINKEIRCRFLHELKQKELFVIMKAEFAEKELVELFYPISGGNIDFKIRIMENYRYGLEINELASRFGMNYTLFSRQFKKEFGESMQNWMLKQKAKHIMARLAIPTVTISDIVKEFDFTDTSHFVRFCRKQYQCTPTELIKTIRATKTD